MDLRKLSLFFIFLFLLAGASARNFTVYNSSNPSTTYFIINGNTGKIGIGTVSPTTKLDVNGTATATEFVGGGSGLTGITGSQIGLTNLSQLIDDLGNRGYTNNLNFTNGANYYNSSNFVISDYYLKSNPFGFYNSTTIPSYILTSNDRQITGTD